MPLIDLTESPFDVTQPWQGNDASVPDYGPAVQLANDIARDRNWGISDWFGNDGARILFPDFTVTSGIPIVQHSGVAWEGHTHASSTLLARRSFDSDIGTRPTGLTNSKHFVDMGDRNCGHAVFGNQITRMRVAMQLGILARPGDFTVFSNNAQDTKDILGDMTADGGSHYGGIKYMEGLGGASLISFSDIKANARKDALALGNVPMAVKVSGSTMVEIDGFEPACSWVDVNGVEHPELGAVSGSYGLMCLGGDFHIRRVHGEKVKYPLYFGEYGGSALPRHPGDTEGSAATDNSCQAYVERVTGGGGNDRLIWEDSPKWHGKITRDRVMLKTPSIAYSFFSTSRPALNSTVDIVDRSRV